MPFQCTVTTMEDFLILQKTKKMLRSGTNITLPREKIQKLKPIASIPKHLVPFQCTWTFDSATNHDRGQGFATFALRSSRFVAVQCAKKKKKKKNGRESGAAMAAPAGAVPTPLWCSIITWIVLNQVHQWTITQGQARFTIPA